MKREQMSPDEREEYDALLIEAGFDDDGLRRPTAEIGTEMHRLLVDAQQAGRTWAGWVLADDAEAGHVSRFKRWDKARRRVKVITPNGEVVPRAAVVGVRRQREDGTYGYQQALYPELTWAEVEQKLAEANSQAISARINAATARRLLALREHAPTSAGPAQACVMLGLDMRAYLAGEQGVA